MNIKDCIKLSATFNNDLTTIINVKELLIPKLNMEAHLLLRSIHHLENSNAPQLTIDRLDADRMNVICAIKHCKERLKKFGHEVA